MEFPWYTNISWYGNLLELFGAIFGVLQYVGVDKLAQVAVRFNVWKKDNFVTVGLIKFPVDQSLVGWRDEVRTVQSFLIEIIRKNWKSYIALAFALVTMTWAIVEPVVYFGASISGKNILWIDGGIVFLFSLPFILYALISSLFMVFVLISSLLQALVYLVLYPVLFVLKYTSKYREGLIIGSVFIVIIGLSMQVIAPIVQSENLITWFSTMFQSE